MLVANAIVCLFVCFFCNKIEFSSQQREFSSAIQLYVENAKTVSTFTEKQNNVSHFAFLVSQINAFQ